MLCYVLLCYVCMRACMYVRTRVCIYVRIYVYMDVYNVCTIHQA